MRVYEDITLTSLEPWSGAKTVYETLTTSQLETLEPLLEDVLGEDITKTNINDFFWFEENTIAELLGFYNWEELKRTNEGVYDKPIEVVCFNIVWDYDEEDIECLPTGVSLTFDDKDDIDSYLDLENRNSFLADKLSDDVGYAAVSFDFKEVQKIHDGEL